MKKSTSIRLHNNVARVVSLVLLGSISASHPAEAGTRKGGALASRNTTYAAKNHDSGWVPFEIYGGHLYLTARVNGHEVPALLDSGASVIVVSASDAPRLGIAASGTERGDGFQGSATSDMARSVSVAVGNLTIRSDKVAMPDLTSIVRKLGRPVSVVIGGEFFRDAVVEIDFAKRRLEFRNPSTLPTARNMQVLALHEQNGLRVVDVRVEGRPARMLFDLGNGGEMNLRPRFWKKDDFLKGRPATSWSSEGYAGVARGQKVLVRTLCIGDDRLSNVTTQLLESPGPDAETDGNIGLPIWSRFHLTVDFRRDRLLLSPHKVLRREAATANR